MTFSNSRALPILLLTSLFMLTACGSGSEDKDPAANNVDESPKEVSQIVIAAKNNLKMTNQLQVTITQEGALMTAATVLICHPDKDNRLLADYQNCLTRRQLAAAKQHIDLTVPNHIDQLYLVIWQAGKQHVSILKKWQRSIHGTRWQLAI